MSNAEKLIARILNDANAEADGLIAAAENEKAEALKAAKKDAEAMAAELLSGAKKKVEALHNTTSASAERILRNAELTQRRAEISATLSLMLEQLKGLPQKEYFDRLLELAKAAATGEKGVMLLDPSDLSRVPDEFKKELQKLNIEIDTVGMPISDGGFVLRYGQIEINNRFGAMGAEKKEQLEDFINRQLFEVK